MGIEVPAAHIHDDRTGEYRVVNEADAATSGGDIGKFGAKLGRVSK